MIFDNLVGVFLQGFCILERIVSKFLQTRGVDSLTLICVAVSREAIVVI